MEPDTTVEVPASTNGSGEVDNSLLARLRAERQALTEKRTIDKSLPGFSLTARFRAIDYPQIQEIQERARKAEPNIGARAYLNAAADILAQMCVGVYERKPNGDLVPLNELLEKWGDDPIRFDNRLCEAVGVEPATSARGAIFAVFGVDEPDTGNDVVMMDLSDELARWVKDGHAQADADF